MNQIKIGCITKWVFEEDTASIKQIVKDCKIDLLVFPEGHDSTANLKLKSLPEGKLDIVKYETNWSKQIGCAMIVGMKDRRNNVFNVFVNPYAKKGETKSHIYIKHTMTGHSAFEWESYIELYERMFQPILFQEWRIGMTICYDSNFPIFSRMYGKKGIDLIVNSTGSNAKKSKWLKYHKVRSIENHCISVVTMLCDENTDKSNWPTYCFNSKGGIIEIEKCVDGVYVYKIEKDKGIAEEDPYYNQKESINKKENVELRIPVGNVNRLIEKSSSVDKNIYCYQTNHQNVIFCLVKGNDILKPEKVLPFFYNKKLDTIKNKCFVIVNQHKHITDKFFRTQLDTVLKVRAVENLCAVLLESDDFSRCYQCTNHKESQVIMPIGGYFDLDLKRTHGPKHTGLHENKQWTPSIEFLVEMLKK